MKLDVKLLGEREVSRELERLAKQAGVQGRQFADEAAAVGMKALVRRTQPFGLGGAAKKKGENAVRRDVGRAFVVVPDGARGADVIRTVAAAEAHHRSVRNSRGRVPAGVKRRRIARHVFFSYRAQVLTHVGTAKGAMAAGEGALGVKGMQKWITRSRRHGAARRRGRLGRVTWELAAYPKHVASENVLGERGAAAVLKSNERNLKRSFEARIRRRMKQAGKRL